MRQACVVAWNLLDEYFESKGRESPRAAAERLLSRILVKNHRWTSDVQRDVADAVVRDAHFDVDDVAENFLGLDLSIRPLHQFDDAAGAPVFGFARPASRSIVICDRANEYEPLYRATAMHEMGHAVLHVNPATRALPYSPSSPRRPKHEREADEFMHESLLPIPILRLAISWLADSWSMDLRQAISLANTEKARWQWRHCYFPGMINTLCVSRHLIALKMKHLGVFSAETYRYHLSYALPNRWLNKSTSEPLRRPLDRIVSGLLAGHSGYAAI